MDDGATRPVYYESRVIHLKLDDDVLRLIDAENDIMAQNAEDYAFEKSKKELEGSKQYVIPLYQRIYSWEQSHCERLWSDIVTMHKSEKPNHFIGTIVNVAEKTAPVGIQEYSIIDGQQHLTTLSILLLALRNYAKKHGGCGINSDEINEKYLVNKFKTGDDKYKLLLTQSDREALKKMIETAPIADSLKSRVIDNYDFFYMKIEKAEITPADLREAIGKLQLVERHHRN